MATFNATFENDKIFNATFEENQQMNASFEQTQVIETGDYEKLSNKPKIESHELIGDKTFRELGLDTLSVQDVEKIFYVG